MLANEHVDGICGSSDNRRITVEHGKHQRRQAGVFNAHYKNQRGPSAGQIL